jgi:antitoxin component YwqK of YwqJK toxin-antitoxin module
MIITIIRSFVFALFLFNATTHGGTKQIDTSVTETRDSVVVVKHIQDGIVRSSRSYMLSSGFSINLPILKRFEYLHGTTEEFYKSGATSHRSHWKKGRIVGNDTAWHENGTLYFITTYDTSNERHGVIKYYNEHGSVDEEATYKHGQLHGKFSRYYSSGGKKEDGKYYNDKKQGWWRTWYKSGVLKDSVYYDAGFETDIYRYYKNGELYMKSHGHWAKDSRGDPQFRWMLVDIYTSDGKLVSQVRNGNGHWHVYDEEGSYEGLVPVKDGLPRYVLADISLIRKEDLIKSADPRYPPKKIPQKKRAPFDIEKYNTIIENR